MVQIELLEKLLIVSSYCETLGFFNGDWEFNFGFTTKTLDDFVKITNLIHNNYIFLGGSSINISKLKASDDTILTLGTVKGIIEKDYTKGLLKQYKLIIQNERESGTQTLKSLNFLKNNPNKKFIEYQNSGGGNGASIRTSPIGIIFDNYDEIIKQSYFNSIVTHNQVLGFLGGISVALITSFAKKNISPLKWFDELLLLENRIEKIISKLEHFNQEQYSKYKYTFWNKIKDYNENRIINFKKGILFESNMKRFTWLLKLLRPNYESSPSKLIHLGSSGIEVIILSMEAILLSFHNNELNFEQLIYYGVLHFGDNDSTGSIVGAWYASFTKSIPYNIIPKHLEFYKEIKDIIKQL